MIGFDWQVRYITEPEALAVGDIVVLQTMEGNVYRYTIRSVMFGMRYEGDEAPRIIVAYYEHLGQHAFPGGGAKVTDVGGVIGVLRLTVKVPA